MKILFSYNGVKLEYERKPMAEDRFRALCLLGACGMYAGLVLGVVTLCGETGALLAAGATVIVAAFASL